MLPPGHPAAGIGEVALVPGSRGLVALLHSLPESLGIKVLRRIALSVRRRLAAPVAQPQAIAPGPKALNIGKRVAEVAIIRA